MFSTHLLIIHSAAQCASFGPKPEAGVTFRRLFLLGRPYLTKIARKSTGFRE